MSGIAELERDLIRKRCAAGIVLDASQRKIIAQRYAKGETIATLARDYACGDATIWRCLHGA